MNKLTKTVVVAGLVVTPAIIFMPQISAAEATHLSVQGETAEHRGPRGRIGEGLAEFLGITFEEVDQLHDDGKRLPEILEQYGKTTTEFHQFMMSRLTEKLSEKVESGDLTQEEADEIISNAQERHQRREEIRADVEAKLQSGVLQEEDVRDYIHENYARPEGERGIRRMMRDLR